jgi:cytoskeleton protein RodZ
MSEVAQTLGQRLKAERERRGVSMQKAADEMHLDAWVIDALETGDYQRIGPPVYAKGHLKRYATILGLPTAEVVSGYDTKPASPAAAALQPSNARMRFTAQESAGLSWAKMTAFAAIAVAVGGIIWWRPWHQRSTVSAAAPAGLPASASPPSGVASGAQDNAERPAEPAATAASPAALPQSSGAAHETDSVPGTGPARLRLSFSADSWVEVHDSAGRRLFAGNGRANSVKAIAGTAPLKVYLGYASGVQLEINDRVVAIGPQFVSGDAARFEAGADAVLRRDSRAMAASGAQSRSDAPHD